MVAASPDPRQLHTTRVWGTVALVLGTVPAADAALRAGRASIAVALYAVLGWAVGRAALDRVALRQSRDDLGARVELMATLDRATDVEETCRALTEHLVDRLGFSRSVALLEGSARVVGARSERAEAGTRTTLVAAGAPRGAGIAAGWVAEGPSRLAPALRRHLDPLLDPLLSDLIPIGANLVAVPLHADGSRLGVVVGEWAGGPRARFPALVGRRLLDDTFHAGAALRAVLLREQVEQRSRRDLLTGLANRRGFDESLDRELARATRTGSPLGVVLVDLDHFKAVNDTLGHQVGDGVLAAAGRALGSVGRGHDLAARIGGDEFALLVPGSTPSESAVLAERARRAVVATVGRHGVTASIGVAAAPGQGKTSGAVVRAADAALYEAKSKGRDQVVVSDRAVPGAHAPEPVQWSPRRPRIVPAAPGLGTGRFRDALPSQAAAGAAASIAAVAISSRRA